MESKWHQVSEERFQTRAFETAPWMQEAACKEHPTSWWFPENSHDPKTKQARSICKTCPVRIDCLDFALARNDEGIWAGYTMRQRRKLRRAQGTTKMVVCARCKELYQVQFEDRTSYCSERCKRTEQNRRQIIRQSEARWSQKHSLS